MQPKPVLEDLRRRNCLRVSSIFLREADFLLAGEQRDLTHLGEVHPHRIVDA
jgi:hypothetical protein